MRDIMLRHIVKSNVDPGEVLGVKVTLLSFENDIDPILIFRWGLAIVLMLTIGLLSLFAYLTLREIKSLNRVLKTPLAPLLFFTGLLYLLLTVGTLLLVFSTWIRPLF